MDDTKDTQKTSALSVFLDGQTRTNPFGLNRAAERAYRRAERIASPTTHESHTGYGEYTGEIRVRHGLLSDTGTA